MYKRQRQHIKKYFTNSYLINILEFPVLFLGTAAVAVNNTNEIVKLSKGLDVIAIDEIQFFKKDIIKTCTLLSMKGIRIILAGLDMDYLGRPFGAMPELMSIADDIIKLHGICEICSGTANHTFRITKNKLTIDIGEKDKYQAVCRVCFNKKNYC